MKSLSKTLLAVYLFVLLWLLLFKFTPDLSSIANHGRSLNLIPFADSSRATLRRDVIFNFVIFIPLGLLLSINFKQVSFWRKLTFVCMASLAVELTQFVFAIGATDITDVITNTSGGLVGLLLYDLANKYIDTEKLDRFLVVVGAILLVLLILLMGALLSHGVRYQSAH